MLKGLLFSELKRILEDIGERTSRAEVLCAWLYHSGRLIQDIDDAAGDANDDQQHRKFRDSKYERSRIGKATRKNIKTYATADGGIRLKVESYFLDCLIFYSVPE